jgi:hypothetical protein
LLLLFKCHEVVVSKLSLIVDICEVYGVPIAVHQSIQVKWITGSEVVLEAPVALVGGRGDVARL